jgi:hypothetical protein
MESLRGRVWRKTIAKADLQAYQTRHAVILTRLAAGRTLIHVLSDNDPEDGFAPVEAGLEDVYFTTLANVRHAA